MVDIAIDTDALKLLPIWTAICTFMGFSMGVQSQQRCATARSKWPCFGGYEVAWRCRHVSLPPDDVVATTPGTAYRGLAAAVGSQLFFGRKPSKKGLAFNEMSKATKSVH